MLLSGLIACNDGVAFSMRKRTNARCWSIPAGNLDFPSSNRRRVAALAKDLITWGIYYAMCST